MKCYVKYCNKNIPDYRIKKDRITCSKICGNAWSNTPLEIRREIMKQNKDERNS